MLTISTNTKHFAINQHISKTEIASIQEQARVDFTAEATGESRTYFGEDHAVLQRMEKQFSNAWARISKFFSSLTANDADLARDHLYNMFKADYAYKHADGTDEKNEKRAEFLSAFAEIICLVEDADKANFQVIYDEKSERYTVAIFAGPVLAEESGLLISEGTDAPESENLLNSISVPLFDNPAADSHWTNIQNAFPEGEKAQAMQILNRMCNSVSISENIQDFRTLTSLAKKDAGFQNLFKIAIKDACSDPKDPTVKLSIQLGGQILSSATIRLNEAENLVLTNVDASQIEELATNGNTYASFLIETSNQLNGFKTADKPRAAIQLKLLRYYQNIHTRLAAFNLLANMANEATRSTMHVYVTPNDDGQIKIQIAIGEAAITDEQLCHQSEVQQVLNNLGALVQVVYGNNDTT